MSMEELLKLIPLINNYDIVVGHRFSRNDSFIRKVNSKLYNFFLNLIFDIRVKDLDSVKLFNKKIFEKINIKSRSAFIETEILIKAKKLGFKIGEVPINHFPRLKGCSSGNNFKIVSKQLYDLIKFCFGLS